MKRAATLALLSLTPANLAPAGASAVVQTPKTILVPREKVSLLCTDTYFKSVRQNFLLLDETYLNCTLRLPLALRERWPGVRTFYVIPRVSASLHSKNSKGQGKWQPLSPLVTPGGDPMHVVLPSRDYQAIELSGNFGKLSDVAGEHTPDTVSTGGKITVCAAPTYKGEEPCKTFDVTARFKIYTR